MDLATSIFVIAGESSGDLHAESLIASLKEKDPSLSFSGVAGPRMRALGTEAVLPMEAFQIMGFVDVFFALPRIMRQFYQLKKTILSRSPKAVIFIDYPGFNLRMAAHLRKARFPGKLIHYICPKVWAWNKKRIDRMARDLDLLLCILPFEPPLFAHTNLSTTYVGNPLVERIKRHVYRPLPISLDRPLIALFPGSRLKEISRNFPFQLKAAQTIASRYPNVCFAISIAHPKFLPLIKQYLQQYPLQDVRLLEVEQSYDLMKRADYAIAKSGTVILELALHKVPTVVTYGISPLDLFIARDLLRINLPFYTLPNLILKEEMFPELIGPKLTQDSLNHWMLQLMSDPLLQEKIRSDCEKLKQKLGSQSASNQAAEEILRIIT